MQASMTTLFHEVERLDNRSLDTFIANITSLRSRRSTPDEQKQEVFPAVVGIFSNNNLSVSNS